MLFLFSSLAQLGHYRTSIAKLIEWVSRQSLKRTISGAMLFVKLSFDFMLFLLLGSFIHYFGIIFVVILCFSLCCLTYYMGRRILLLV